jgi:hypothetical protein
MQIQGSLRGEKRIEVGTPGPSGMTAPIKKRHLMQIASNNIEPVKSDKPAAPAGACLINQLPIYL